MKFKATFVSGGAVVGTLFFEEHWEDFIQRYESDLVLQKKVWFERQLGCPVSVEVEPVAEKRFRARPRSFGS